MTQKPKIIKNTKQKEKKNSLQFEGFFYVQF